MVEPNQNKFQQYISDAVLQQCYNTMRFLMFRSYTQVNRVVEVNKKKAQTPHEALRSHLNMTKVHANELKGDEGKNRFVKRLNDFVDYLKGQRDFIEKKSIPHAQETGWWGTYEDLGLKNIHIFFNDKVSNIDNYKAVNSTKKAVEGTNILIIFLIILVEIIEDLLAQLEELANDQDFFPENLEGRRRDLDKMEVLMFRAAIQLSRYDNYVKSNQITARGSDHRPLKYFDIGLEDTHNGLKYVSIIFNQVERLKEIEKLEAKAATRTADDSDDLKQWCVYSPPEPEQVVSVFENDEEKAQIQSDDLDKLIENLRKLQSTNFKDRESSRKEIFEACQKGLMSLHKVLFLHGEKNSEADKSQVQEKVLTICKLVHNPYQFDIEIRKIQDQHKKHYERLNQFQEVFGGPEFEKVELVKDNINFDELHESCAAVKDSIETYKVEEQFKTYKEQDYELKMCFNRNFSKLITSMKNILDADFVIQMLKNQQRSDYIFNRLVLPCQQAFLNNDPSMILNRLSNTKIHKNKTVTETNLKKVIEQTDKIVNKLLKPAELPEGHTDEEKKNHEELKKKLEDQEKAFEKRGEDFLKDAATKNKNKDFDLDKDETWEWFTKTYQKYEEDLEAIINEKDKDRKSIAKEDKKRKEKKRPIDYALQQGQWKGGSNLHQLICDILDPNHKGTRVCKQDATPTSLATTDFIQTKKDSSKMQRIESMQQILNLCNLLVSDELFAMPHTGQGETPQQRVAEKTAEKVFSLLKRMPATNQEEEKDKAFLYYIFLLKNLAFERKHRSVYFDLYQNREQGEQQEGNQLWKIFKDQNNLVRRQRFFLNEIEDLIEKYKLLGENLYTCKVKEVAIDEYFIDGKEYSSLVYEYLDKLVGVKLPAEKEGEEDVSALWRLYKEKPGSIERMLTVVKGMYDGSVNPDKYFIQFSKFRVFDKLISEVIKVVCRDNYKERVNDQNTHLTEKIILNIVWELKCYLFLKEYKMGFDLKNYWKPRECQHENDDWSLEQYNLTDFSQRVKTHKENFLKIWNSYYNNIQQILIPDDLVLFSNTYDGKINEVKTVLKNDCTNDQVACDAAFEEKVYNFLELPIMMLAQLDLMTFLSTGKQSQKAYSRVFGLLYAHLYELSSKDFGDPSKSPQQNKKILLIINKIIEIWSAQRELLAPFSEQTPAQTKFDNIKEPDLKKRLQDYKTKRREFTDDLIEANNLQQEIFWNQKDLAGQKEVNVLRQNIIVQRICTLFINYGLEEFSGTKDKFSRNMVLKTLKNLRKLDKSEGRFDTSIDEAQAFLQKYQFQVLKDEMDQEFVRPFSKAITKKYDQNFFRSLIHLSGKRPKESQNDYVYDMVTLENIENPPSSDSGSDSGSSEEVPENQAEMEADKDLSKRYKEKFFDEALSISKEKFAYDQSRFDFDSMRIDTENQWRIYDAVNKNVRLQERSEFESTYWLLTPNFENQRLDAKYNVNKATTKIRDDNELVNRLKEWKEIEKVNYLEETPIVAIRAQGKTEENEVREFIKNSSANEFDISDDNRHQLWQLHPLTQEAIKRYNLTDADTKDVKTKLAFNKLDKSKSNGVKHFYCELKSEIEQEGLDPFNKTEYTIILFEVDEEFPTRSIMQPIRKYQIYRMAEVFLKAQELKELNDQIENNFKNQAAIYQGEAAETDLDKLTRYLRYLLTNFTNPSLEKYKQIQYRDYIYAIFPDIDKDKDAEANRGKFITIDHEYMTKVKKYYFQFTAQFKQLLNRLDRICDQCKKNGKQRHQVEEAINELKSLRDAFNNAIDQYKHKDFLGNDDQ